MKLYEIDNKTTYDQRLFPKYYTYEISDLFSYLTFKTISIKQNWKIIEMEFGHKGKTIKTGDILGTSGFSPSTLPIFSQNSFIFLSPLLLELYGDFLPVSAYGETYYIFHSQVHISYDELKKGKGCDIFRLTTPPFAKSIIVSENFVNLVKETKLKGFKFNPLEV